ncbi:hypothetical protein QVD17_19302 [Tagetes erecta]|uniref:F-box domain-containing protein n=1 Tax=Tagetes erecta TaxID=13708 RepID=A0AAD8NX66_TARER|nr:hypothetical protein QVD17_19302 [Tagetes erecta]
MANVIDDDVVRNILGRLPGKPLLRCRRVSKHWNRLISDPYFMKTRSRRMVLLPFSRPLVVLDDNVPVKDKVFVIHSPSLQLQERVVEQVSIVGTFNGVVLLALTVHNYLRCDLILYNPLTSASKKLVAMDVPASCNYQKPYVFGCVDDLKHIVRFELFSEVSRHNHSSMYTWDVFDLKTSLWSGQKRHLKRDFKFWDGVGIFLNGFLYWAIDHVMFGILALNVKEMVFSRIKGPVQRNLVGPLLGSIDGCLCMVTTTHVATFDFWVRKEEEGSWLKQRSFTIHLATCVKPFRPVCILGNGNILFTTRTMLLVMYDTSKGTYEKLFHLINPNEFEPTSSVYLFKDIRSIEYVESLVSPFDT